MRRAWLVPVLLAVVLVLQLTVIDGLHLPKGGVPDLVLVLLVVLAMTEGPLAGVVTGFVVGLCLDIAPPGSPLVGQYALVFCLAGWAAGSLGRFTKRSPLRTLAAAAFVIAAAEVFAAGLGKVLEPAQVSVAEIRQFLPISVAYDLLICPFALYLVILAMTTWAGRGAADSALAGTGLLGVQARSGRKPRRVHQPRLNPAAARAGDGWVGRAPGRHPGSKRPTRGVRLHPGTGVAGSASGYATATSLPARPVKLRLSDGRRNDGVIGSAVGSGHGRRWQTSRHPGMLAGASHQIRFGGELGGSATRNPAPAGLGRKPLRINFRGALGGSAGRQHGPAGPSRRPVRINFRAHGGSAGLSTAAPTGSSRLGGAVPRLRMGGGRSALSPSARVAPGRSVPTVRFRTTSKPIARRPSATPKFRRTSGPLRSRAPTAGLVTGGVLAQSTLRARRMSVARKPLRLSGKGRGLGMLGGGGVSTLRRPPTVGRKQPRFGYGRRSFLTFLTRRRVGGQWLAKRRAGRRSGAWLIGKRTGGLR